MHWRQQMRQGKPVEAPTAGRLLPAMSERQIEQSLTTRHGTVVRDKEEPLPGLSQICLLDDDGQVLWFAELPQQDDSYRDEMRLIDDDTIELMSWFGWCCRIALKDGTMVAREWTAPGGASRPDGHS